MRIYHFCADRHVKRILHEGLRIGGVMVPSATGFRMIATYIWLTLDSNPKHQSWATRSMIPYSRTDWRLTIEIPEADAQRLMDRDALEAEIPGSEALFIGWPGSENWRVYHGFIPKEWIVAVDDMRVEAKVKPHADGTRTLS